MGHVVFRRDVTSILVYVIFVTSLTNVQVYIEIFIDIYLCVSFGGHNLGSVYARKLNLICYIPRL